MYLFQEGLAAIAKSMNLDDPIEESTNADVMFIGIRGMEFIQALSWKHDIPVDDHPHRLWKLWRFTPTEGVPEKYHSMHFFMALPYLGQGGIRVGVAYNEKGWASVLGDPANLSPLLEEIDRLGLVS